MFLSVVQVKCFAGEEAPKYAPDFFAASCKGFWSGIFGHRVSSSILPSSPSPAAMLMPCCATARTGILLA